VKNKEFYSLLLESLANQSDVKHSATIIGEKIQNILFTDIEILFSFHNGEAEVFYARPDSLLNEVLNNKNLLKEEYFAAKAIRALDSTVFTGAFHTLHMLYCPVETGSSEKFILLVGRNSVPFTDEEKEFISFFAELFLSTVKIISTIELNKAAEAQLIQRQKFESLGKLTSGIAHDFSNLLSSIFGSVNLLKKKIADNNDALRLVDNIESCSVRAKDLTSGLLAYGKPKPKQKEILSANNLAQEIYAVVKQTFPAGITFTLNLAEDVVPLQGNGTQIYQILLNLCINARDALNKKGSISLSTRNVSVLLSNAHLFPSLVNGNYVCFSVEDSGSGISPENISKIFDPYFTTKASESSSGLGLYITYGIIKAHNGSIQVTSKVGEGTRFNVYLPAYEEAATSEKKIAEKIILLADDEEMLQDLLSELLESHGYYVIKVPNGKELLKVITEEIKADLAIIDYNMPEMNGAECVTQIRKLGFTIPIILSSGSLGFADKKELAGLKIDANITKPYDFDTMLATVTKLL